MAKEDLEPQLLSDKQEEALIQRYLEIGRGKISEWIGNVFEGERQSFTERLSEPDVDASNCYLSPAAVDLIQIIRQHLTTTSESGNGRLTLEAANDTVKTVVQFQERIVRLLQSETEKFLAKPDAGGPSLFEPYVLMMGNTGVRWAASLQSEIIDNLDAMIAVEYMSAASKQLKTLSEGVVGI